jgi:hypothetical protein
MRWQQQTSGHSYPRVSRWLESIYTLQKKNLTNTSYARPRDLTYYNHSQVPTKLKSGLYSQDEVLTPNDVRPGCHPALSHSPSNKPPWSREGWFDKIVTKATKFTDPIKTRHAVSINQSLSSGTKRLVFNRHRQRLPHKNLRIATTLCPPFRVLHGPLVAPPSLTIENHNIYSPYPSYPSIPWKEGVYMRVWPTTRLLPIAINYA